MKPLFSLIIPSFNRVWVLPKTLGLIQAQTFQNWELIVVDDGSTDETKKVVEDLQKIDPRITYVYQENARQAAARQSGFERAQGEWVTYVDTDDELYPNYLETLKEFTEMQPAVWYGFVYNDRTLEVHDKNHQMLFSKTVAATDLDPTKITLQDYAHWKIKPCGTGIFHKRELVKDGVAWSPTFILFEDIDFVFQLGLKYPEHFGFLPQPLFKQRQAFGSDGVCSGASYADWANGFEQLYQKGAHTWLMQGQEWYPSKVQKYREHQKLFEAGKLEPAWQRHFSEYFKLKD